MFRLFGLTLGLFACAAVGAGLVACDNDDDGGGGGGVLIPANFVGTWAGYAG